jgi:hypothetical protein
MSFVSSDNELLMKHILLILPNFFGIISFSFVTITVHTVHCVKTNKMYTVCYVILTKECK